MREYVKFLHVTAKYSPALTVESNSLRVVSIYQQVLCQETLGTVEMQMLRSLYESAVNLS